MWCETLLLAVLGVYSVSSQHYLRWLQENLDGTILEFPSSHYPSESGFESIYIPLEVSVRTESGKCLEQPCPAINCTFESPKPLKEFQIPAFQSLVVARTNSSFSEYIDSPNIRCGVSVAGSKIIYSKDDIDSACDENQLEDLFPVALQIKNELDTNYTIAFTGEPK